MRRWIRQWLKRPDIADGVSLNGKTVAVATAAREKFTHTAQLVKILCDTDEMLCRQNEKLLKFINSPDEQGALGCLAQIHKAVGHLLPDIQRMAYSHDKPVRGMQSAFRELETLSAMNLADRNNLLLNIREKAEREERKVKNKKDPKEIKYANLREQTREAVRATLQVYPRRELHDTTKDFFRDLALLNLPKIKQTSHLNQDIVEYHFAQKMLKQCPKLQEFLPERSRIQALEDNIAFAYNTLKTEKIQAKYLEAFPWIAGIMDRADPKTLEKMQEAANKRLTSGTFRGELPNEAPFYGKKFTMQVRVNERNTPPSRDIR